MILGISINYYKVEKIYMFLYILTVRIYNLNIQYTNHFIFYLFFIGRNGISMDVYFWYEVYYGYFWDVINYVKAVDPKKSSVNKNAPKNE